MSELSPAAQAVLDAVCDNTEPDCDTQHLIAAALRAAADQVVPDDPEEAMHFTTEAIRLNRMSVRANLLAIAVELEAQPEPVGPTDEELDAIWFASGSGVDGREWRTFARAVLARWGRPAAELEAT